MSNNITGCTCADDGVPWHNASDCPHRSCLAPMTDDERKTEELKNAARFWREVHIPLQTLSNLVGQKAGDDTTKAPLLATQQIHAERARIAELEREVSVVKAERQATREEADRRFSDYSAERDLYGESIKKIGVLTKRCNELERELAEAKAERDEVLAVANPKLEEAERVLSEVFDTLDLNRDEFARIASCPAADSEIKQICERSQQIVTQRISVIRQRDEALAERNRLRKLSTYLAESLATTEREIGAVRDRIDGWDEENAYGMVRRIDNSLRDLEHHLIGTSIGTAQDFGEWFTKDGWKPGSTHPLLTDDESTALASAEKGGV